MAVTTEYFGRAAPMPELDPFSSPIQREAKASEALLLVHNEESNIIKGGHILCKG
jgi:hypothetical protein